jgi:hypothetical protein
LALGTANYEALIIGFCVEKPQVFAAENQAFAQPLPQTRLAFVLSITVFDGQGR